MFGDYGKLICNNLREKFWSTRLEEKSWTVIFQSLEKEEKSQAAWMASGSSQEQPRCPVTDTVCQAVETLQDDGWSNLDLETAIFGMRIFVRRNSVCHGETENLHKSGNASGLDRFLAKELQHFEKFLPDGEAKLTDKYRKLLTLFRDWHSLPGRLLANFKPVAKEPSGITGTPAVEALEHKSLRRDLALEPRGTKKPASEQSYGEPPPKRLRAPVKIRACNGWYQDQAGMKKKSLRIALVS